MCGQVLSSKNVKIRKPRRCWGCTNLFQIGSMLERVVSVDNRDIHTGYWCDDCIDFTRKHRSYINEDCFDYGELQVYKKEYELENPNALEGCER